VPLATTENVTLLPGVTYWLAGGVVTTGAATLVATVTVNEPVMTLPLVSLAVTEIVVVPVAVLEGVITRFALIEFDRGNRGVETLPRKRQD